MTRWLKWMLLGLLLTGRGVMLVVAGSLAWLGSWLGDAGGVTLHVDDQAFHLGAFTAGQALLAGLGVVIGLVVCIVVVPLGLLLGLLGLLVPVVVIGAVVLGVLLPVGAVLLAPVLLLVWLVARQRRRGGPAAAAGPIPRVGNGGHAGAAAPAGEQA
jgi:hypothetical protein